MANMDATYAYGEVPQLSFPEPELLTIIDNNVLWEDEGAKEPYACVGEAAWLHETYFFRDAFLDSELDDSEGTLAADDASFFTGDDAPSVATIPHIKTEETKPTLTLDCRPPAQQRPSQHLTPTSPLVRTPSKRQRSDIHSETPERQGEGSDSHNLTRKRSKRDVGGYPCPSCGKPFDRECDLTKHHNHTHIPQDERRHPCQECGKRFNWPKDVRRHWRQVHKGLPPVGERRPSMAWLTKTLVMLKKLRLKASSPTSASPIDEEKVIMVTADKQTFVKVDVSRLADVVDLRSRIAEALGYSVEMGSMMNISRYHRTFGFEPLSEEALMEVVEQDADADMSLKMQVSVP